MRYKKKHGPTSKRRRGGGGRKQDPKQSFAEEEDEESGDATWEKQYKEDGEENRIRRKHGPPAKSGFLEVGWSGVATNPASLSSLRTLAFTVEPLLLWVAAACTVSMACRGPESFLQGFCSPDEMLKKLRFHWCGMLTGKMLADRQKSTFDVQSPHCVQIAWVQNHKSTGIDSSKLIGKHTWMLGSAASSNSAHVIACAVVS